MLFTQTVDERTLALLKRLMSCDILKDFYLVGGTALSLQYGHRISIDLDFFGSAQIDFNILIQEFKQIGELQVLQESPAILQAVINKIKVDVVKYPYELLEPLLEVDGIRLVSPKDIAAMKITAIGTRAAKKDFYDLYFLLENYHLAEVINFCNIKFPEKDMFHYIKSLCYFDEVENDPEEPHMLKKVTWDQVKKRISWEANKYLKL